MTYSARATKKLLRENYFSILFFSFGEVILHSSLLVEISLIKTNTREKSDAADK